MSLPQLVLASDEIVTIAMIGGLFIAVISIIGGFIRRMHLESVRGKTQREIAAYVAEGAMTPEEGERLMKTAAQPVQDPD
ncbi:MAG: hypothetical protein JNK58_08780 [Phycisphaerae bacterium]|nr:hypothetical protein [Phycisphaerae bacterium]